MKIFQKNIIYHTHRTSEGIDAAGLLNIAQFLLLQSCAISNKNITNRTGEFILAIKTLMRMNKLKPTTVKQLIRSNPEEAKTVPAEEPFLTIAEFFCNSIQGENFIGWPATGKSST